MIRTFPLLCMVAALSGCASLTYPLPKCDGYSRHPLNRSMWQWEDDSSFKQNHAAVRSVTAQGAATAHIKEGREPPAFAHLDIDASYRPSEG